MKNFLISTFCFIGAFFCTMLLFVGLFSAKWDYIIGSVWDTVFVLAVGTAVPVLCLTGAVFTIKGIMSNNETLYKAALIFNLVIILFSALLIGSIYPPIARGVLELYEITFSKIIG